jgi:hypothetical protein
MLRFCNEEVNTVLTAGGNSMEPATVAVATAVADDLLNEADGLLTDEQLAEQLASRMRRPDRAAFS